MNDGMSIAEKTKRPQSYRDLLVWQKGIQLAREVYQITAKLPSDERFGLVSQMGRAAVSISSNIAEGQARNTTGEFIQFVSHAEGSTAELDTQFFLSVELGQLTPQQAGDCLARIDEMGQMLNGLRRKLSAQR
jgi:four helix bundle protein